MKIRKMLLNKTVNIVCADCNILKSDKLMNFRRTKDNKLICKDCEEKRKEKIKNEGKKH